ncbi:MAG: glycosyltransferase [Candidatus Omnitrophota bacterium]
MKKRILFMYISKNSGHHHACCAMETAFHALSSDVETFSIDSFLYTNPIFEKIITKTYLSVIKRKPEIWGYLYDNPHVVKKTQKFRESVHRYNSKKMKVLIDKFKPDAVLCAQAFPCGILADYKKTSNAKFLLAGVLTDYAPHAYWMFDNVDLYFVPSEETRERLIINGISPDRIKLTGIPIDSKFSKEVDKEKVLTTLGLSGEVPTLLVMGGSQGIGPMTEIAKVLENSDINFQIIFVAGGNKKLQKNMTKIAKRSNKKIIVLGYVENIDELMEVSSLIISKPGGITTSESLSKALPILIVNPIPGHEQMNTNHLLKYKAAVKVDSLKDIETIVRDLFSNKAALQNMRECARSISKPNSATDIARIVLERIM